MRICENVQNDMHDPMDCGFLIPHLLLLYYSTIETRCMDVELWLLRAIDDQNCQ